MLTSWTKEKLVPLGARLRADFLVEQAGYTLGISADEGVELKDLLPEGYLEETQAAMAQVSAARQDKALLAEEAKDATKNHNVAAAEAKVWRRKVSNRALRATRIGAAMPDTLLHIGKADSLPELAGQVDVMVKLFEENLAKMPGKGAEKLVTEGKALAGTLKLSNAEQEVKRFSSLPAAVQDFYTQKGTLYLALKAINDAGHELHAGDSHSSARFNLSILHRRRTRKAEPEGTPAEAKKE